MTTVMAAEAATGMIMSTKAAVATKRGLRDPERAPSSESLAQ